MINKPGSKVFLGVGVNNMEGMQNTDTVWLVSECIAGNEEAVASLFRVYEVSVYRLALSILDDPAEANEITQETFLAALRSLNKYQEKQSFKAWLYTIAVNHSRSHLRKRRAVEKLQATLTRIFRIDFDKQLSPEETVIQDEKEAALWKSLNQLDDRYRMVVVLRYFHELSVREISQILAVNEGTIHSRLHKARETLRMELEYLNQE